MAEINFDEVSDLATKYEIDPETGILGTDIRTRPLEYQPENTEFGAACRHPGKFKSYDHALIRKRIQDRALAETPQQDSRVKVGRPDPVACMNKPPMSQIAQN